MVRAPPLRAPHNALFRCALRGLHPPRNPGLCLPYGDLQVATDALLKAHGKRRTILVSGLALRRQALCLAHSRSTNDSGTASACARWPKPAAVPR